MSAEIRKLLSLPTPRWTAIAVLACGLIAAVVVYFAGTGGDPADILAGVVGVPLWIASIVIGAWMIGVEYGQKTMRRALSADPRRLRLIAAKLAVVLGYVVVLTVVATAWGTALLAIAAAGHGGGAGLGDAATIVAGTLTQNLIYAVVGFFLALFTRSMAGGMTVALAFGFIIDSALSAIPKYGDYSLSIAAADIYASVVGSELAPVNEDPDLVRALIVTAAWLTLFGLASGLRFLRSDVT